MSQFAYLNAGDVNSLDQLYQQYLQDPASVDASWAYFFQGFDFQKSEYPQNKKQSGAGVSAGQLQKELGVHLLIEAYRQNGHLLADVNPMQEPQLKSFDLAQFGLAEQDKNTAFQVGNELGLGTATLQDILNKLKTAYTGYIGFEYTHLVDKKERDWFQAKAEKASADLAKESKISLLEKLTEALQFELFLNKKFVGQKRFSVEGAESYIAGLDAIIEKASEMGVLEVVLGMAHRGRLNTLVNIMQKPATKLFTEFEGKTYDDIEQFDGDVKYHFGHKHKHQTRSGKNITLTLSPNPSHLETVNAVVGGLARARIESQYKQADKVLPILVHGDAALAGQGIVYEVVQMSGLAGYAIGGTVHIAINNQVGFTTNASDARTARYCTDVAKVIGAPVLHVHGDDVEAVAKAFVWAVEYRQTFQKDIFIDLLCYRKYGHNEGDEPKFTQPTLYAKIDKQKSPQIMYAEALVATNVLSAEAVQNMAKTYNDKLEIAFEQAKATEKVKVENFLHDLHQGFLGEINLQKSVKTQVDLSTLKKLGEKISTLPSGKNYFRKSKKIIEDRANMLKDNVLDWGMGESLAYASLLAEGHPVRLSGQDVERGTFSHRHAVITTEDTEEKVVVLNMLSENQAKFSAYNSLLSEYGVLGFEWGYAAATPNGLTIWEAQFGDFNNGAQIVIDQYLASAEDKWKVPNGLVLLLPHGFEGQGSEHSSARLERFLQLCAEENMQVLNCSTPANLFHALRRQVKRDFRKPLVIFSPKQLLRHPKAVSSLEDLAQGEFLPVIADDNKYTNASKVVLCAGKLYYELLAEREKQNRQDIALVRLEQLYPFPAQEMAKIVAEYKQAKTWLWAQEEPENMGAWVHVFKNMRKTLPNLEVASRPESASPAPGSSKLDALLQQKLHKTIFG